MNKTLEERYADVLADIDPAFLDYEIAASRKLKGWRVESNGGDTMAYVTKALDKHRAFYAKQMAKPMNCLIDSAATGFNTLLPSLGARTPRRLGVTCWKCWRFKSCKFPARA